MPTCLVIGAGTAGATVARGLALRGVDVLLVERRTRENAGACWVNGVQSELWEELELGPPPADLLHHRGGRFLLADRNGELRQTVEEPPQEEVDMRALNRWLLGLAEEAGVRTRFRTRAEVLEARRGSRMVRLNGGAPEAFDVVVDARGYQDAPLPGDLYGQQALTPALDVCNAWQAVYAVRDPGAARDWLREMALEPGDTLARTGVEGGFSTCNVMVDEALQTCAILCGTMHREGYRSGGGIAADARKELGFLGKRIYGGGGLIPLAPLASQFVADSYVAIGGRAGQIFPQHGSGVALGMRSAACAANAVAAALQLGDPSRYGLWGYNVAWQRRWGAHAAFYQPLLWLSSSLSAAESALLLRAGVLNAHTTRAALALRPPTLRLPDPLRLARQLPELVPILPRLALAFHLARRLQAHHQAFPSRGPRGAWEGWHTTWRRLMQRAQALALSGDADGSLPRPRARA